MQVESNNEGKNAVKDVEFTFCEKELLKSIYLCVLVKGTLPNGEKGYCYFGLFGDSLVQILKTYRDGQSFNPRDVKAIVLARSTGEPSTEIVAFMRHRFSFAEDQGILEISRR
jgi:hypothetical protein